MMFDIHDCIRSRLPGRLRLRHPALCALGEDELVTLRDMLSGMDGMTSVTINPRVGSVLLCWDPEVLSETALLETLAFYAAALGESVSSSDVGTSDENPGVLRSETTGEALVRYLDKGASAVEAAVVRQFTAAAGTLTPSLAAKNGRRAARVLQNRTMLGLLAGSMAVLGVKQTGWHVGVGAAFLALLLVHLHQHRRVL